MPAPAAPVQRPRTRRPLNWLRSLLQRPLKLERRGLQLHVVLAAPAPAPQPQAPESPGEVLRRGHAALRDLLARHPEVRHLMRHLGFLEQALARAGSKALRSEVPLPVLRKAHEQLELLMRDDVSADLTALSVRLERSIAERGRAAENAPVPGALLVSEASHSLFDEMERSWTGQMPLAEVPPPPGRA